MKNPIKMDDLEVPLFLETPISGQMESYFTNLDFPELRGPISLPSRYIWRWDRVRSRYIFVS